MKPVKEAVFLLYVELSEQVLCADAGTAVLVWP
jgi:hypothetical protein